MKISIIVTMLNEIELLPDLFAHLLPFQRQGCEILFVDGGSDDGSAALAEISGFTVLHSTPGRARQFNNGAAYANGEVMLFLHVDSRLPIDAIEAIIPAMKQWKYQWGRFDVTISGQSLLLKMVAFMMNWRSLITSIATGDQAIFIRRSLFIRIGGFPEQPLMEDIELCKKLKKDFPPACLHQRVSISGRRWEIRGMWYTIFLMWKLRWKYWRGVSAEEIAAAYK